MTGFEKYISTIFHSAERHKEIGSGRLLMRVLLEQNPDLYYEIVGIQNLDPRWDVSNQPAFIDYLINNWKEYSNA